MYKLILGVTGGVGFYFFLCFFQPVSEASVQNKPLPQELPASPSWKTPIPVSEVIDKRLSLLDSL